MIFDFGKWMTKNAMFFWAILYFINAVILAGSWMFSLTNNEAIFYMFFSIVNFVISMLFFTSAIRAPSSE